MKSSSIQQNCWTVLARSFRCGLWHMQATPRMHSPRRMRPQSAAKVPATPFMEASESSRPRPDHSRQASAGQSSEVQDDVSRASSPELDTHPLIPARTLSAVSESWLSIQAVSKWSATRISGARAFRWICPLPEAGPQMLCGNYYSNDYHICDYAEYGTQFMLKDINTQS